MHIDIQWVPFPPSLEILSKKTVVVIDVLRATSVIIEVLSQGCHFTDCRHRDEPRCAVKAAIEAGTLTQPRLDSYLKLQDEMSHLARQQDERAQLEHKRRSKVLGKALKQHLKSKRG